MTCISIAPPRAPGVLVWQGKHSLTQLAVPAVRPAEAWILDHSMPLAAPEAYAYGRLLFQGDNSEVLAHLLATGLRGQVKLVYIDPPFDSGADYLRRVALRGRDQSGKGIVEHLQYTDVWAGDSYLQFMYERLLLLRDLLRPDGALYLHCNTARSHHLRAILDEVFGPENFRNEIIVRRIRKNIRERRQVPRLNDAFDQIFFYANGPAHRIHPPEKEQPRAERWHAFDAPNLRPNLEYELFGHRPPPGRHWLRTVTEAQAMMTRGDLRAHPRTGKPEYRVPASTHVLRDSLWDDVTASAFGTGYPTEKKEELLRLIVEMSTDPGDLVLDAFAGSGTTLAVSQTLGRRWIGIDSNAGAIHTSAWRLHRVMSKRVEQASLLGTGMASRDDSEHSSFHVYQVGTNDGGGASPAAGAIGVARVGDSIRVEVREYANPAATGILAPGSTNDSDWRCMVDAVLIDSAYDGRTFRVALADVPERRANLVAGLYTLPAADGPATVAVKIVDVLGTETIVTQPLTD